MTELNVTTTIGATHPPKYSETLSTQLQRATALTHWLLENQPTEFKASLSSRVAGAFFSIALEHETSVVLLLSHGCKSAAFALLRSIWEAYWRGLWAVHLADDELLNRFYTGRYDPKAETTVSKLKKTLPEVESKAFAVLAAAQDAMNSYAHGGSLQVQRWFASDAVEPTHTEDEIREVIQFCNLVAFRSAYELVKLAGADARPFIEHARQLGETEWF